MAVPGLARDEIDFLSLLSDANRRRLLEGSRRDVYPAGTVAFRPGDSARVYLIDRGLVRVFWSAADGRQATVAFLHSKELVGATTILGETSWAFVQVVTESILRTLDMKTARDLAAGEIEVVRAIGKHLMTHQWNAFRLVAVRSLGNIADRVAYDLLERACRTQLTSGRLEVHTTQADLADSIGSSREVVSRALAEFRKAGIIETGHGVVRVLDVMRLAETVRGFTIQVG